MSSNFGNFMKNGWHPEKPGTTFKGQVNGLLGRKDKDDRSDHVARPLSSLQDPSTFAPPPKRVPGQPLPPPPPSRSNASSPGVPPPPYDDSNRYAQQQTEEDAPPPQPYRSDTTGLSTSHLPPPPGRKDGADGRTPTPTQSAVRPPPSLPPRLPPRTPSSASTVASPTSPAPPPTASSGGGYLNQNAMNRLGAAGISVPAFGIGKTAPEPPNRSNSNSPAPPARPGPLSSPPSQMNELQNRFAKLGKSSGQAATPPPTEGTTMEQKQAALRTASNFHRDPKSVSMADARSAASTFNNFRQRHGEQVAAGVKSANNLNQKYGIADKVGKYAGQVGGQQQQQQQTDASPGPLSPPPGLASAIGKKKPPPPPPKKKPQLGGAPQPPTVLGSGIEDAPPPIPLSTKPTI
ncbi:hypothetical protein C8034_v011343 [Colletotrichum sidae]|uniref:GMP synthase n=1 Tax=Colletotrichum sidae TaxID=1347389 RepID=A0A4V3I2T2_9PEZI|nr:hypothetical protein C8034_v011343 [Colletotrichum sidae]